MKLLFQSIRRVFSKIPLVDKCLLIIFLVLMLQSAYSLFAHSPSNSEIEHVDVIVRTSAASIFGYLLSANFILQSRRKWTKEDGSNSTISSQSIETDTDDNTPNTGSDEPDPVSTERIQIIVAATIGLFCLITLIVLRNTWGTAMAESSGATATIAQLRDFVSGCVGFLIGCPSGRS